MAAGVKKRWIGPFGVFLMLLLSPVFLVYYALLGEVEVSFTQKPRPEDAREATRKIDILTEAQATKKNGFIRLSEAEINALLQGGAARLRKDRTERPLQLVKAGVLLNENITFVTWHKLTFLGMEFPVVWQRTLKPERSANGWSLAMRDMQLGKVRVPRILWARSNEWLGASDSAFDHHKAWLATLPTLMLSRNEMSQKPELRLYSYIPVVKETSEEAPLPRVEAQSTVSTNSITANL